MESKFIHNFKSQEKEYVKQKIQNIQKNIINEYSKFKNEILYYNEITNSDLNNKYNVKLSSDFKLDFNSSYTNFKSELFRDIKRTTYNIFIIKNNNYYQFDNDYFMEIEENNNLIKNLYKPFHNFINNQIGGDQTRKQKQTRKLRQPGYRQNIIKNKKINKLISIFYLLIFQTLYSQFAEFFQENKTFINDKFKSLRNCIIDFNNYYVIYYQPFLFVKKNTYYVSYIFAKGYINDDNNIKIDMFSYPFKTTNNKLLKDLSIITVHTKSQRELLELLNNNIYHNKTIDFNNNIKQIQEQAQAQYLNNNYQNQNHIRQDENNISQDEINSILDKKILFINI